MCGQEASWVQQHPAIPQAPGHGPVPRQPGPRHPTNSPGPVLWGLWPMAEAPRAKGACELQETLRQAGVARRQAWPRHPSFPQASGHGPCAKAAWVKASSKFPGPVPWGLWPMAEAPGAQGACGLQGNLRQAGVARRQAWSRHPAIPQAPGQGPVPRQPGSRHPTILQDLCHGACGPWQKPRGVPGCL